MTRTISIQQITELEEALSGAEQLEAQFATVSDLAAAAPDSVVLTVPASRFFYQAITAERQARDIT